MTLSYPSSWGFSCKCKIYLTLTANLKTQILISCPIFLLQISWCHIRQNKIITLISIEKRQLFFFSQSVIKKIIAIPTLSPSEKLMKEHLFRLLMSTKYMAEVSKNIKYKMRPTANRTHFTNFVICIGLSRGISLPTLIVNYFYNFSSGIIYFFI